MMDAGLARIHAPPSGTAHVRLRQFTANDVATIHALDSDLRLFAIDRARWGNLKRAGAAP